MPSTPPCLPLSRGGLEQTPKAGKIEEIYQKYINIINANFGERILCLQTDKSFASAVEKVGQAKWEIVNNLIKKNQVIIDGVVPERVLKLTKGLHKSWQASIAGRTTAIHVVPDNVLDFNTEIFIGKNSCLITNWEDVECVEITNKEHLKMLRLFLLSLRSFGKIVNVNSLIRENLFVV
jgi:hypothetical protein